MLTLDITKPEVISPKSANILDKCSDEQWSAPVGIVGENARIIIDTVCPIKLKKFQLINGIGDFSTKMFSLLGAYNRSGPWKTLYKGELQNGVQEVIHSIKDWLKIDNFRTVVIMFSVQ